MKMKLREIGLLAPTLCLMVSYCAGFTQQESRTKPEPASAESQATQVNTNLDRSRVLEFRGVLKGHWGNHPTGTVGMLFAIYEQQQGGAPLWQEVQNVVVDAGGHFTALVGSQTGGGIRPELFTEEKTRWLGEQVLLPGEVERPRIRLVSTPYGPMVERFARVEIPAKSVDQAASAEAAKASGETTDSQQDQSGPTNRPPRARRRLHRAPAP